MSATVTVPKIVGIAFLAPLIGRAESTIRVDVSRRPETLPPRLKIPGSSKVMWLESDVLTWLESCRTAKPVVEEAEPVRKSIFRGRKS